MPFNDLQKVLEKRAEDSLYRKRQVMHSAQQSLIKVDN